MFYMCIYIYNTYIKLKPDVHMYTHMCMYRFPYYVHVTGLCTNYIIHGHHGPMMLGACVWVRCMTTLRMANKMSQFHTFNIVDRVCHSGFSSLLVHGMWHMLVLLSFAAQRLGSGVLYIVLGKLYKNTGL